MFENQSEGVASKSKRAGRFGDRLQDHVVTEAQPDCVRRPVPKKELLNLVRPVLLRWFRDDREEDSQRNYRAGQRAPLEAEQVGTTNSQPTVIFSMITRV